MVSHQILPGLVFLVGVGCAVGPTDKQSKPIEKIEGGGEPVPSFAGSANNKMPLREENVIPIMEHKAFYTDISTLPNLRVLRPPPPRNRRNRTTQNNDDSASVEQSASLEGGEKLRPTLAIPGSRTVAKNIADEATQQRAALKPVTGGTQP